MERRGSNSGKVTHVRCRTCDAFVLLDSTQMHLEDCRATLPCPECGAVVPVRRLDAERPPPEGIWAIASYAGGHEQDGEPTPKPSGLARVLHLRRAHHA